MGRLELAHQGTIFLDEVGDIPLELQPKLLRALQEKEFERLGSTRTIKTDIRIVAATNRDLTKLVASGQFRSDLFYRLSVFPIVVPPLRERGDDIPLLVQYFLSKFSQRMKKNIDIVPFEGMRALCEYTWPGNIRELEHVIERAVILSPGSDFEGPGIRACSRTSGLVFHYAALKNIGSGRCRAGAHHPGAARDQRKNWRTERRGRAPGDESHNFKLAHAEAENFPPAALIIPDGFPASRITASRDLYHCAFYSLRAICACSADFCRFAEAAKGRDGFSPVTARISVDYPGKRK